MPQQVVKIREIIDHPQGICQLRKPREVYEHSQQDLPRAKPLKISRRSQKVHPRARPIKIIIHPCSNGKLVKTIKVYLLLEEDQEVAKYTSSARRNSLQEQQWL